MVGSTGSGMGEHFAKVVLELAPDGIAVTDRFGRIVHANSRFEDLFGHGRDSLDGHAVEMLLPEDRRASHRAHRHDFEDAPTTRPMAGGAELVALHADGTEFRVQVGLSPVVTPDGLLTIMAVREVVEAQADDALAGDGRLQGAVLARIASSLDAQVLARIRVASLELHQLLAEATAVQAERIRAAIDELDEAVREVHELALLAAQPDSLAEAPSPATTEYWIGADDRLIEVGGGWDEFARRNGADRLAEPLPGRVLWSYFAGPDLTEVWRALVARVRAEGAGITVPFRCDAPDAKRWFEMVVSPERDGAVRFHTTLVFEEPRPAIALLADSVERDELRPPVSVCSWCGRAQHGGAWQELDDLVRAARMLEEPPAPPLERVVCPECTQLLRGESSVAVGALAPPV